MASRTLKARRKYKEHLILSFGLKPVRLFCDSCGKYVSSRLPWTCAYCDFRNHRTRLYSFLRKCQECKKAPQALICPHCEDPIPLVKNADMEHAARNIGSACPMPLPPPLPPLPPPPPTSPVEPEESPQERHAREHEERKLKLKRKLELKELDEKLARLKKSSAFRKEVSAIEKLRTNFSEFELDTFGRELVAEEQRKRYAKLFANDSDGLEKSESIINAWLGRET